MRRLVLSEHETRAGVELPADHAAALAATGAVQVTPALPAGRWTLRAAQHAGVLQVGETELWVRPKVPVGRLLYLLGYAHDPTGWRDDDVGLAEADDLVPAMAVAFGAVAQRALQRGVLQGYREREESLVVLRGRLREADQVRRRPGLPLPLEVRYDDYTVDIPENRLLLGAARRLLQLPGIPPMARARLHHLGTKLAGVTPPIPGDRLPSPARNRLTERYRPALRLAALALAGEGIEALAGETRATGFLFDMNRVFEDYLTAALTTRLQRQGGTVRRQHHLWLDNAREVPIRPDITWWQGRRCLTVIDAKYKAPDSGKPPPQDLYQLVAYCTALGVPSGHLVYAAGSSPPRTRTVRNAGITLTIHSLDLGQPKEELLADLDRLAVNISRTADVAGVAV